MASSSRKRKRASVNFGETLRLEALGLVFVIFGFIAQFSWGPVGYYISLLFKIMVGNWYPVPIWMAIAYGFYLIIKRRTKFNVSLRLFGALLLFLAFLLRHHMDFFSKAGHEESQGVIPYTWQRLMDLQPSQVEVFDIGGGMVGAVLYFLLRALFAVNGMQLISWLLFLLGFLFLTGLSYVQIAGFVHRVFKKVGAYMKLQMELFWQGQLKKQEQRLAEKKQKEEKSEWQEEAGVSAPLPKAGQLPVVQPSDLEGETSSGLGKDLASDPPLIVDFNVKRTEGGRAEWQSARESEFAQNPVGTGTDTGDRPGDELNFQTEPNQHYRLPSLVLLNRGNKSKSKENTSWIAENAKKLEATLQSFGVRVKVTQIHRGPAVTRYELQPDVGVKVSRIVSLVDDMALALAAKDIRIEAPVPGKSVVGIEVPNTEISMVTLREVLESEPFVRSSSKLSIALGRDISGEPIVAELSKMPHLLVAGATGSGKSVCINGIIASLLFKAKPYEVKLLMIDPKMVELSIYNDIPHLLIPVVTDPRKASMALKKVVAEMEQRYERFAEKGTREIERYNQLMEQEDPRKKLPYIVVIIDELADLMMVAPTDVEESISRLAQMARACGIHLLIATQRPSVDVITGLIKANIPSRIAFGVSSQIDSRTILDMAGAEKLLGRGDMLYSPVGAAKPLRVQGAFLSDGEVEALVDFVKQQEKAAYREDFIPNLPAESEENEAMEMDELYETAKQMVVEMQQASVSLLQRRLHIGYTRAARLIDSLESQGVIGPYEGSKPREVLYRSEAMPSDSLGS